MKNIEDKARRIDYQPSQVLRQLERLGRQADNIDGQGTPLASASPEAVKALMRERPAPPPELQATMQATLAEAHTLLRAVHAAYEALAAVSAEAVCWGHVGLVKYLLIHPLADMVRQLDHE